MSKNGARPSSDAAHFQIELTRSGPMDNTTVHIECTVDAAAPEARKATTADLSHHIKSVIDNRPKR